MKRWMTLIVVVLIVALVSGAGYLGFRSTQTGGRLDLAAEFQSVLGRLGLHSAQVKGDTAPQSPPTVPVTRGDVQQTVIAPGQLMGTRETTLGMRIGGRLAKINVRPGDVVQAGDVLAELGTDDLRRQIADAEASLKVAQLRLSEAEKSLERQIARAEWTLQTTQLRLGEAKKAHEQQIADAQRGLEAAQLRLEEAKEAHEQQIADAQRGLEAAQIRLTRLQQEPDPTEIELLRLNWEQAKNNLWRAQLERDALGGRPGTPGYILHQQDATVSNAEMAARAAELHYQQALQPAVTQDDIRLQQTEVEQARATLEQLRQEGVDSLLIISVQQAQQELDWLKEGVDPTLINEVNHAQLALERLRAQLAEAQLIAPMDGQVLDVKANPGETVAAGTGLILLTDPTAVEVWVTVIEEDFPLVQTGQPVELFFDAQPNVIVQGHVARTVPQRVSGADRPLYPVYIALDELPEGLAPGMTVDGSITIAERVDVLRLPRALVRAGSGGDAQVEVWEDDHAQKRTIQVGLRGDVYVEILDGLREGEQVVGE